MVAYNDKAEIQNCEPGVTRKILTYNDDLMMVEVSFEKGSQGNAHKHPHQQITYVAAGCFEFTVGDEVNTVKQGDSVLIPSDTMHGVKALENGKLVDIFSPMRKDFLK